MKFGTITKEGLYLNWYSLFFFSYFFNDLVKIHFITKEIETNDTLDEVALQYTGSYKIQSTDLPNGNIEIINSIVVPMYYIGWGNFGGVSVGFNNSDKSIICVGSNRSKCHIIVLLIIFYKFI